MDGCGAGRVGGKVDALDMSVSLGRNEILIIGMELNFETETPRI